MFIGATALELGDVLAVPVYGSLPGIVVQALATETVNQGAPARVPLWGSILLLAFWTLVAALAFSVNWRRNLVVLATLFVAIVAFSVYGFLSSRLLIGIAAPSLVVTLLFVTVTVRWLETQTWRALRLCGRHAPSRRAAEERGAVVHRQHRVRRRSRHHQDWRTRRPRACSVAPAYDLMDEPSRKFITLLAGEGASARLAALHGVHSRMRCAQPRRRSLPGGNFA